MNMDMYCCVPDALLTRLAWSTAFISGEESTPTCSALVTTCHSSMELQATMQVLCCISSRGRAGVVNLIRKQPRLYVNILQVFAPEDQLTITSKVQHNVHVP